MSEHDIARRVAEDAAEVLAPEADLIAEFDMASFGGSMVEVLNRALQRPGEFAEAGLRLGTTLTRIAQFMVARSAGVSAAPPIPLSADKRFKDPTWEDNPGFAGLRQAYLAFRQFNDDLLDAGGGDPVSDGLVASLNRPGGNVTGATFIGTALTSKKMGLLQEILPKVSDIALLVNPKGTLAEGQINEAKAAAKVLGLNLSIVTAISESEFDEAVAKMSRLKVGAFLTSTDPLFGFSGQFLHVKKGLLQRIPAIGVGREDVAAGSLFSYGPHLSDTWRQAGIYIGRILKGEKPSDLPIVQPTKFELIINLKTAKQLGIDISPILLARADEVIE